MRPNAEDYIAGMEKVYDLLSGMLFNWTPEDGITDTGRLRDAIDREAKNARKVEWIIQGPLTGQSHGHWIVGVPSADSSYSQYARFAGKDAEQNARKFLKLMNEEPS